MIVYVRNKKLQIANVLLFGHNQLFDNVETVSLYLLTQLEILTCLSRTLPRTVSTLQFNDVEYLLPVELVALDLRHLKRLAIENDFGLVHR
jgi:hypothetical protein